MQKERSWMGVFVVALAGFLTAAACISWMSAEREEDLRASHARLRALQHQIQEERSGEFARTLRSVALSQQTREATSSLSVGFEAYIPTHLRDLYVELNPYRQVDPSMLVDSRDGSAYSKAHAKHHPYLTRLALVHGWSDIYLVGMEGEVLYSVKKGPGFARNVKGVSQGGVGAVFHQSLVAGEGDLFIARSGPGTAEAGVFYAGTPVYDGQGERTGLLVVKRSEWGATGLVPSVLAQRDAIATQQTVALFCLFGVMSVLMIWGATFLRGQRSMEKRKPQVVRPEVPSLIPATTPQVEHASGTRLVARERRSRAIAMQETGTST